MIFINFFFVFRHNGVEAVLPDGRKLKNWSVSNFAGLHNSDDMKVILNCYIKCYQYFRLNLLKSSKNMESELVVLRVSTAQLIFI